jgi:hypothetical protein
MAGKKHNILSRMLRAGVFIALASCLSPIKVEVDDASGRLIVSGQVSTVEHRNMVVVARTAGTDRQAFTVSGAVARIVDDLGNVWACTEEDPGNYRANGLIGVPGRTYYAEVEIPETGQRYRSEPETLPAVAGQDDIYHDFTQEEFIDSDGTPSTAPFINFHSVVTVQQPAAPYYLKWTASEIYLLEPTDFPDPFGAVPPPCYISKTTDPQRVALFDGSQKPSLQRDFLVAARIADSRAFHSKYSAYIYMSSVTPEAYEYWRKVNILVNQVGSIFDTPPADIDGNVFSINNPEEKVYGYFQASNETYHRITLNNVDMPFPKLPYCEYSNSKAPNDYPGECLNCLNAANSSFREPPMFRGHD